MSQPKSLVQAKLEALRAEEAAAEAARRPSNVVLRHATLPPKSEKPFLPVLGPPPPPPPINLEDEFGLLLDILEEKLAEGPGDGLMHYGIKGMKWGVRKKREKTRHEVQSLGPDKIVRKTKTGEEITLEKFPPNKFINFMYQNSSKYRESYKAGAGLSIRDSSGKKVGTAQVQKKNDDELYLSWLGIDKSARGKGYATTAMQAAGEFGRQQGFKKLTLEVPTNAPDAHHIYKKMGFKYLEEVQVDKRDTMWGGLTKMEYEIDQAKHGMSDVAYAYYESRGLRRSVPLDDEDEDDLIHYGVKGMKWGQRRAQRKADKKEHKEWLKGARSEETGNKVFQKALDTYSPALKAINNDPAFKGKDMNAPENRNLSRMYDDVTSAVFNQHMAQASADLTYNPKTDRAVVYQFDRNVGMMRATEVKRVQHAADADPEFPDFRALMDSLGHIVKLIRVEDDEDDVLEQTALTPADEDVLIHYGVKGMKWGVRRKRTASLDVVNERRGDRTKIAYNPNKLKVAPNNDLSGNKREVKRVTKKVNAFQDKKAPSKDFREAQTLRSTYKLAELSNKDLKKLNERMQLEQNYNQLVQKNAQLHKGKTRVQKVLSALETVDKVMSAVDADGQLYKNMFKGAF